MTSKEWTSGETHAITDRSSVVRRVLRLNDHFLVTRRNIGYGSVVPG